MEKGTKGSAKNQILTALVATIPTFTYGIQIGWLSPMAATLKGPNSPAHPPLTDNDISFMAAVLLWAAIAGIPFFSYASDRFGRKITIILVSLLSCISWIIMLTATKSSTFILARAFAGLAAGGCFVVVPVYVKEISQDSWRGSLGSLVMTVCKVGVIAVYAFGMSLSFKVNQALYLAICIAHMSAFVFMPESPNFLVRRGKEKEATKVIAWLRSLKRHNQDVMDELIKLKDEQRSADIMPKVTAMSIIRDRPTFAALRMTMVLMAMQTLSGCFALMNYAADVFARAGTTWSPNTLALFVGALQLAGSLFTTVSIERFGRKIPLAGSAIIVSLCMTTLATYFLVTSQGMPLPPWVPVAAVCVAVFAYGAGLAPVPFVVMAEVFSYEVRARMAGASMAFSFFCSSLTVLFYTPVANLVGPYAVFYAFGIVGLLGFVYTILWVPETKGKSLEEIRDHWREETVDE